MTTLTRLTLLFCSLALAWPAHAQTPLEDGSNANTWIFDAAGNPTLTYRIGGALTTSTSAALGGVTVSSSDNVNLLLPGTTSATHVMVNRLGGSLPVPALAPIMSVISLGQALADTATAATPSVVIAPASGTFTTTVRVTAEALPAATGVGPLALFVSIDGALEIPVSGTSFEHYFIADGVHTLTARAEYGSAQVSATNTFTLTGELHVPHKTRDSDGDGIPDGIEVDLALDPLRDDTHDDSDGDGWSDFDEILRGTSPIDGNDYPEDGDGDGWSDWDEELRGTDPLLATSKPVAAAIDAVEYLVSGAAWLDAAHTLPHDRDGFVAVMDATWQTLAWFAGTPFMTAPPAFTATDDLWYFLRDNYQRMPLATFGEARVRGDGDVIVTARTATGAGLGRGVFKTQVGGSPAATPALVAGLLAGDFSGGGAGWLLAYEAELAAYLVQPVAVDLDPESGLATALCEVAVAWAAGLEVGAPVLLGEPEGARTPEAVAAVAFAFADLVDFVNANGFEEAVAREDLVAELFAAPEASETTTTTWTTALRLQRAAPDSLAVIVAYHARLIAYSGWQRVLDFTPYNAEPESDPWLPTGDADQDGITNTDELAAGPAAATDPLYPDSDDDGTGDLSDPCPRDPSDGCNMDAWFSSDTDQDGVLDGLDNCFGVANRLQTDTNGDLIGDACEAPARIARPVANIAVLAPGEVDFSALDSAAAAGTVSYRWLVDGDERSTAKSFSLSVPANAQPRDVIVRLFAADASGPEAEVDRRLVRILVRHGPVPCLAMTCDDGDPCTDDACDLVTGCFSTRLSGCSACITVSDCNDGNVCTNDACPAGVCVLTKNTGTTCSDGNACSTGDLCNNGQCAAGSPLNCADADPCTVESCDAIAGCLIEPDPTPDPVLCPECSVDGDCGAGSCVGGLCCEATAAADGTVRIWNPGDPAPSLCLVGGMELVMLATSGAILSFKLKNADGTAVMSSVSFTSIHLELESVPGDGPHTLVFTATQAVTWTLTESHDVAGEISAFATQAQVITTAAGSEAYLTFDATLDQVVSARVGFTGAGCEDYRITNPSGVQVADQLQCGATNFFEPFVIDEEGVWTLMVDSRNSNVGTFTATVWEVLPEAEIQSAFDSVARNGVFETPGETIAWLLEGTAGTRISIVSDGNSCATHRLLSPTGEQLYSQFSCGVAFTDAVTLTESGTYRWVVDPSTDNLPTATVTAHVLPDDQFFASSIGGGATTLSFPKPGLVGTITFAAVLGDVISVTFTGGLGCTYYSLLAPSGAVLESGLQCGTEYFDRRTLSETGTYTMVVNPNSFGVGTVSATVHAVPADVTTPLTIGAAGVPMAVTAPGQNLAPTFVGSAGASVKIVAKTSSGNTYTVLSSIGTVVFSSGLRFNNYTSTPFVLPSDDTYTLLVDVRGSATPTNTLSVSP